jgi:hypothetical protein
MGAAHGPPSIKQLKLGPLQLMERGPSILWHGTSDAIQISTRPLGFDGASEADR